MEQFNGLPKPEREEAILKRLIYYIQCDINETDNQEKQVKEE